jgi:hypothetical protein
VPALPGVVRLLVPPADLFMLVMLSRPSTGSLADTWVTPATLYLAGATALIGAPLGVLLVAGLAGRSVPVAIGGLALLALALGGAAVAVVGVGQRVVDRRGAE